MVDLVKERQENTAFMAWLMLTEETKEMQRINAAACEAGYFEPAEKEAAERYLNEVYEEGFDAFMSGNYPDVLDWQKIKRREFYNEDRDYYQSFDVSEEEFVQDFIRGEILRRTAMLTGSDEDSEALYAFNVQMDMKYEEPALKQEINLSEKRVEVKPAKLRIYKERS
jgi:hypothetical protein